jgi:hypothetical protein
MFAITSLEFNLYAITIYDNNIALNKNVSKMQELVELNEEKSITAPV